MAYRKRLEKFEAIAQRVVEGSLGRVFGGMLDPVELSAELARAIDDNKRHGFAPNQFTIELNPSDKMYLEAKWPDIASILNDTIHQIASQWQLKLPGAIALVLAENEEMPRRHAHIRAAHLAERSSTTQMMAVVPVHDPLEALQRLDAFLIVNGNTHLALDRPTMTLGRHSESDIRLKDKAISRHHAQLRWRFGRFVLHDLGSQAGTFVNDRPVDEIVLRPGDVIRLAGVSLLYGEGLADTRPRPAVSSDEQTKRFIPPFPRENR